MPSWLVSDGTLRLTALTSTCILAWLSRHLPNRRARKRYPSLWQCLRPMILSSQCIDAQVLLCHPFTGSVERGRLYPMCLCFAKDEKTAQLTSFKVLEHPMPYGIGKVGLILAHCSLRESWDDPQRPGSTHVLIKIGMAALQEGLFSRSPVIGYTADNSGTNSASSPKGPRVCE